MYTPPTAVTYGLDAGKFGSNVVPSQPAPSSPEAKSTDTPRSPSCHHHHHRHHEAVRVIVGVAARQAQATAR